MERVEPVYEAVPGWQADTSGCRAYASCGAARDYVERLETVCRVPIRLVSVGAERSEWSCGTDHRPHGDVSIRRAIPSGQPATPDSSASA